MLADELYDLQPLSWDMEDVDFAIELIQEADEIMSDVLAGLAIIKEQPDLLVTLQHNVQLIYKAIKKLKGKNDEPHIRLAWSHLAGGVE